jgi:propionyl-CoA carboxylase alpha chain
MRVIRTVLIANRGEIAVRVMRTCKALGIRTVAVYSDPDATSPHVLMADDSVPLGGTTSAESYLDMQKLIAACITSGADALHPGYGFLSENATFASLCKEHNIDFIGPDIHAIKVMGDKTEARKLMEQVGIPLPPGTTTALTSTKEAEETGKAIGYPVLIKAAAGGGGKGMRIVYNDIDMRDAVSAAQSEAKNAFGDERVYVEKYLEEPRHIEVQILADKHGNIVHFFDRECSIQRRHQKVVEEAPSPFLDDEMRAKVTSTAVEVARSCNYVGAGTVEFLADKHKNFYFLEMNTRLQVEHPVTEMITGYDLVEWQLRVAMGEKLSFSQSDIHINGHAVESRICAEDPAENFLPSTGQILRYNLPVGSGVRVDSGVREGQHITINYDPLMAKLVTHGENRQKAIARMRSALEEYSISGLRTTIPFCIFVMNHEAFQNGQYDTHFVKDYFKPEFLHDLTSDLVCNISAILSFSQKKVFEIATEGDSLQDDTSTWWTKRRH